MSKADTVIPENIKEDINILGVTGTYNGGGQPVNWLKVENNSETYFKGNAAGYSGLIFNVDRETIETIENINKYSNISMYLKYGAEDYNFIFSGKYKHQKFDNIYLNYKGSGLVEPGKTSEKYYLWNFENGDYGTITITHK